MCDTAGTLPRQQSPTQKVFRFPTGEQALVVNVDYSLSLPPPPPLSFSSPTRPWWTPALSVDACDIRLNFDGQ